MTGHFKPGEGPHHGWIWAQCETGCVDAPEHFLDVVGVFAAHMALKDVLDHCGHGLWSDRGCVNFAVPNDTVGRGQFYKDEVAPTPGASWRADYEYIKVL